jgi:hypothetical protein
MSPSLPRRWLLPAALACLSCASAFAQPYLDRVLDEGPQPHAPDDADHADRAHGLPRGWRSEVSALRGSSGGRRERGAGLGLSGFVDTANFGSLSGSVSTTRSGTGTGGATDALSLWRLEQRAMPLDGGWFAHHGAGILTAPVLPLARPGGRVGLPTTAVEGFTAQYLRGAHTQLVAALGRPGWYGGAGIDGFSPHAGRLATLGAQHAWRLGAGDAIAGVQAVDGHGLADRWTPHATESVSGVWVSAGWRPSDAAGRPRSGLRWQAHVLTSRREGPPGPVDPATARGAWLDLGWASGGVQQQAGVLVLAPGLRWGGEQPASDLRGAWWQADLAARQWQWSAALDATERISTGAGSVYATGTARYRLDTRNAAWASAATRTGDGAGRSGQLGVGNSNAWGQTQLRLDALEGASQSVRRIGVDHAFAPGDGSPLALSLGLERAQPAGAARPTRLLQAGLVGSLALGDARLDANLLAVRGAAQRQASGNLALAWPVAPGWSLALQYTATRSQAQFQPGLLLSSALATPGAAPWAAQRHERLQLTLRYEERAGTASAALGGTPGGGSGRVAGSVYFDLDGNGRRDPGESGIPEIAVVLDGRWVTRTDAQGRFDFAAVGPGEHALALVADNLPLPWTPRTEAARLEVRLRSTTVQDLGVVRDR